MLLLCLFQVNVCAAETMHTFGGGSLTLAFSICNWPKLYANYRIDRSVFVELCHFNNLIGYLQPYNQNKYLHSPK